MITPWDDYFIHQTPQPILQPFTTEPNWMDRFWWGGVSADASTYIAVSMGQYRTTNRMDAIVYAITEDRHRILKLAKNTTPDDFVSPSIGPLHFEITDALKTWSWTLGENPTGAAWDLQYTAGRPLHEYEQFVYGATEEGGSDYHHFVQTGTSTGSVTLDGVAVSATSFNTIRDRSWGIRQSRDRLGMFIWIHHAFESANVALIYSERRDGTISYLDGSITDSDGQRAIVSVGHDLKLGGGRDVLGGTVSVVDSAGRRYEIGHERLLKGFPGPVGYGGWAGKDHSEELTAADGYLFSTGELDLTVDPAEIIASSPIHIYEHPSRVWLDGAEPTVSIMSGGMTRSTSFDYAPKALK